MNSKERAEKEGNNLAEAGCFFALMGFIHHPLRFNGNT